MKITKEFLKRKRACADQVALFAEEWPEGAEVTLDTCLRAAQIGLDFGWAAENLLSADGREEWRAKRDVVYAEYLAKRDVVDAEWRAKREPIDAECRAKREAIDAEWRAKLALIDTECRAKRAVLFYELFAKENT